MLKRFGNWLLTEGTVPVSGFSFFIDDANSIFVKLRRLKAVWDARRRIWSVPEQNLALALSLSPKLKELKPKQQAPAPVAPAPSPAPPAPTPAESIPTPDPKSEPQASEPEEPEKHGDKVYVYNAEPRQWNRVRVYISSLGPFLKQKIEKGLQDYLASKNIQMKSDYIKQEKDDFYLILPGVNGRGTAILDLVLKALKDEGYDIGFQDNPSNDPGKPKIRVIGVENGKLVITYKLSFFNNQQLRQELANARLWPNMVGWLGKDAEGNARYGFIVPPTNLSQRKQYVEKRDDALNIMQRYLNTSALIQELRKLGGEVTTEKPHLQISFADLGKDKAEVKFSGDTKSFEMAKQMIKYTFPGSSFNPDSDSWRIYGDYQQYVLFKKLLDRYNWNSEDLQKIIDDKVKAGGLVGEPIEGDVPEGFDERIEAELPDNEFELNQLQKEGIAFLCHRKSAILGDETGFGKTVQLVSAAEMKMKEGGYKGDTIIFVPSMGGTIAKQWEETILKVIGRKNGHLISLNPFLPRRWTILTYDSFSIPKNMHDPEQQAIKKAKKESIIKSLKEHNFMIVILDELHKVKKEDAAKSENIAEAIANIPIHWGASATISSNWPIDVKNQLVMVNHHLGKIDSGLFNREFAGNVSERGTDGKERWVPGQPEDRMEAAENLNKWLHLTGLYVRRGKNDVREMPNLSVTEDNAEFDYDSRIPGTDDYNPRSFMGRMAARIAAMPEKNKKSVVTIIQAARHELSLVKVPSTIKKVTDLVKQGRKVVVFSAFLDAIQELTNGLRAAVKSVNPAWDILTYTSKTPEKDLAQVKTRFTNEERFRVVLMSLKMGGTGIDFPNVAQNMIINDYEWTPEQAEQSEGRIFRINTEKPVKIEYMIAKGTIDEPLFDKVQQKRYLAAIIHKYRKDYQEEKNPEEALKQIIKYRKELEELEKEIGFLKNMAARSFNRGAQNIKEYEEDDIFGEPKFFEVE